jgi:VIT1/CCC1 family predicted Fe2+/Mn2+ transporter
LNIGPQIGTATASMLTLFAYRFALGGLIPKVSYFTRMDSFITASTLLAFLALLVAILTGNLAKGEHGELAQRIDVVRRTLFPGSFAGVIAFSFWL